ncbi:MAG TPA: hypothetical protein VJ476_01940 [Rhizomicrobium sp.]|nr:hypothetical protein [Rhizomicrobium sp.]
MALAIMLVGVTANDARAELSIDDAGHLADAAFRAVCPKISGHSEMNTSTAQWHGDRRFVWFHTNFFVSDDLDGMAMFAVDRRTGAVWAVDDTRCNSIDSSDIGALRISLHLKHRTSRPPAARYCHF